LKNGAPVRLSGYDIGSVSTISLTSDTSALVEVKMRIDNNLKHFIRIDSEAAVETEGLVGKKIVSVTRVRLMPSKFPMEGSYGRSRRLMSEK